MVRDELSRIQQGWSVIGSDGGELGKVVEVHEGHLVVEGGSIIKHNLYVPASAVTETADERVSVAAPAGDADQLGWRFPPDAGITAQEGLTTQDGLELPGAASERTTMTGAAYGAGAGVSSAGPLAPGHGDAIADRFGGSGRAGLSGLGSRPEDEIESLTDDDHPGDATDDTNDDTSEDTSDDTSRDEVARLT